MLPTTSRKAADQKAIAIHRSERICIDISDSVVSVIKLDPQGVMMRAGSAKAPALPGMPDDAYVTDLSAAIKKAAWAAKVSMGFGASCVVGVSMPDMTIQRFRWPDMPTEALLKIAAEEMAPYLPNGKSNYHIACEVLSADNGGLEVMAAAMPEEHAVAVDTACRWANFKPKRIDVRENARSRLVNLWCAPIEGAIPSTFAILDAGPGAANIAFYYNGLFHSNRYFAPEFVKLDEVDDFEMLMSVKAGGIGNNESAMRYNTAKLTEEIASAVNHFHRLTDGHKISCILLMDDENIPGIEEGLRTGLGTPVLKPSQWVKPGLKRPNLRRTNQDSFLDAFAVGMPSLLGHECRLDLSIPNPPPAGFAGKPAGAGIVRQDAAETAGLPAGVPAASMDTPRHVSDPVPQERADIHDGPKPIPAGYVELPEIPPELVAMGIEDRPTLYDEVQIPAAQKTPAHHESPFDIVSAKASDNSGFPYAIPEDPRPDPNARKPIFLAAVVAVVILLIAVLVPLRSTMSLRAELRGLQEGIGDYVSAPTLFMMQQELSNAYRQIDAVRLDIDRVNERMGIVRDFYLRLPAMVFIPEVLEASGLAVESVVATEQAHDHRIVISGHTNNILSIPAGIEYLRRYFQYNNLLTITIDIADTHDSTDVDAYGYTSYTLTIVVNPGWTPFWLNSHVERSWP